MQRGSKKRTRVGICTKFLAAARPRPRPFPSAAKRSAKVPANSQTQVPSLSTGTLSRATKHAAARNLVIWKPHGTTERAAAPPPSPRSLSQVELDRVSLSLTLIRHFLSLRQQRSPSTLHKALLPSGLPTPFLGKTHRRLHRRRPRDALQKPKARIEQTSASSP